MPVRKTAKGDNAHPAKFSAPILGRITGLLEQEVEYQRTRGGGYQQLHLLDPFGGVGGIHRVVVQGVSTTTIEIEEEWWEESYKLSKNLPGHYSILADFFEWARDVDGSYDIVVTSPTYGNRMADHHVPSPEDVSVRNTYTHVLGRQPSEGSSSTMQWGDEYRQFHARFIRTTSTILAPGGLFLLNVSDHIRKGVKQPVVAWYKGQLRLNRFELVEDIVIPTKRLKMGANSESRVDGEHLLVARKVQP